MSVYGAANEEQTRLVPQVKDWVHSNLLTADQGARLETDLRTDLRRTHVVLRAVLAGFTALVIAASVMLVATLFDISSNGALAILSIATGLVCWQIAELLIAKGRLYRHGVEEALLVASVASLAIGAALFVTASDASASRAALIGGLLTGALTAGAVFIRFRLIYSGVAAFVCAAAIPFQISIAEWQQRSLAAVLLAAAFALTWLLRVEHREDYQRDDYDALMAASWIGAYLVLNLRLDAMFAPSIFASTTGPFYWATYIVTWLMPAVGIVLAVGQRSRPFLDTNLVLALITLATSKPYLQWPRQSWDPMILGTLLVVGVTLIRRWLSRQPDGEWRGFTAARLLASDRRLLGAAGTVSAALPLPSHHAHAERPDSFGGGTSGGAGATGGY